MNRELDGVYFRVKRGDRFENLCFSDLTEDEMKEVMENKTPEFLKSLCKRLASALREIGDDYNIVRGG